VPYTYEYPRPAVTVDCVLFAMREADVAVLLVQRKNPPYRGAWALPGGFVNQDEALDRAAYRELAEETGITSGVALEQLRAYGDPGRDPRGHTVSVVFSSFLVVAPQPVAGDDAAAAAWHELRSLPRLAFDHAAIVAYARSQLVARLFDHPETLPFPARFTLPELQSVYEAVTGKALKSRSFRARLLSRGVVEPIQSDRKPKRGALQLYRFRRPGPLDLSRESS
jgi:8-oxo-dGTP diphosphatase